MLAESDAVPAPVIRMRSFIALVCSFALSFQSAHALDNVLIRRDGKEIPLTGRILVTAQDGGLLLETSDGVLWPVQPAELAKQHTSDEVFKPDGSAELSKRLLAELPHGFEVHTTAHYLICHNTSRAYASWTGALLERLYRAFTNYWTRKGLKLHEPDFPLVAIVFADRNSYLEYAKPEVGEAAGSIIGYYSLRTNRVTMYDLTGIEAIRRPGDRRGSPAQVNAMLARPEAEHSVATVIHEATHQIAFNSGLQTRFADIPLWLSEGIAMYFETPDLSSAKGWRNIGAVNQMRLPVFRKYVASRPADSLKTLIADDSRVRDPKTALDAYAEAWALNYYLARQKSKQYCGYLKMLSEKKQLFWDDPATRLKEFEQAFGSISALDADFVRQMQKVR